MIGGDDVATDFNELTNQLLYRGMIDPEQKVTKNFWQRLLAQMAMAQKMDARTMAGFALGKLLRGGFDTWLANKRAKEQINDKDNFNNRNQTPTSSPANFDSLPEVSAPFQNPQLLGDNVSQAADITSMLPADIDWEKALNYLRGVR